MQKQTNMGSNTQGNKDAVDSTKVEVPTLDEVLSMKPDQEAYSKKRIEYNDNGNTVTREFIVGPDNQYHLTVKQTNVSEYDEMDQSYDYQGIRHQLYKDANGGYQIRQYNLDSDGNIKFTERKNGGKRAYPIGWLTLPEENVQKLIGFLSGIRVSGN